MKVCVLLLLCVHVLCTRAGRTRGPPEPELTSLACNDTQAEAAADLSLRQLNAHRKEGFAFGLKRISNVQEQYDVSMTMVTNVRTCRSVIIGDGFVFLLSCLYAGVLPK